MGEIMFVVEVNRGKGWEKPFRMSAFEGATVKDITSHLKHLAQMELSCSGDHVREVRWRYHNSENVHYFREEA